MLHLDSNYRHDGPLQITGVALNSREQATMNRANSVPIVKRPVELGQRDFWAIPNEFKVIFPRQVGGSFCGIRTAWIMRPGNVPGPILERGFGASWIRACCQVN
jgi:hypothetical protein